MESTTDENGNWMLRSMDLVKINDEWKFNKVKIVASHGYIGLNTVALDEKCGIRPAMRINLDSVEWKYAGKVLGDGTVIKPEDIVKPTQTPAVTPIPTITPTLLPTLQPTKSPVLTPTVSPTQSATPSVSTAPTSIPSATPTITPQPATTPANTGNQVSQSQQQQPTPQAGANTNTTADNAAKVSLIKQSKVSLKTAKNTKGRKLTASWKKASNADGYQIQYAPNKKFKKAKSQTVKSTSVKLKKLKKKTTYFVRVRAYKTVDGKKVYGKWSSVKKVKIKK